MKKRTCTFQFITIPILTLSFLLFIIPNLQAQNYFAPSSAGANFVGGSSNVALGEFAGENLNGWNNTLIGYKSGQNLVNDHCVHIGTLTGTNSTGVGNVLIGYSAGHENTTGYHNTYVGANAGRTNTEGNWNTALGISAGEYTTNGVGNTFLGGRAGIYNQTGRENVFIGLNAGVNNISGHNSIGIGSNALTRYTGTGLNTVVGHYSMYHNLDGTGNVALGAYAGQNNDGSNNVFIGQLAGYNNTNGGSRNVYIGYEAGKNATGNDQLHIANNAASSLIYGDFAAQKVGINTINPENALDVCGTIRGKEILVDIGWCDYVFLKDYPLPTLKEEKEHIQQKGHLMGFESEKEMNGQIQLGDVTHRQQVKIEEMMLHLINMQERLQQLEEKVQQLEMENASLKE